MTLRHFIRLHRRELDDAINTALYRYDGRGGRGTISIPPPTHNDEERRQCILNCEGWARSEGVPI
jgi:hypothetical protein